MTFGLCVVAGLNSLTNGAELAHFVELGDGYAIQRNASGWEVSFGPKFKTIWPYFMMASESYRSHDGAFMFIGGIPVKDSPTLCDRLLYSSDGRVTIDISPAVCRGGFDGNKIHDDEFYVQNLGFLNGEFNFSAFSGPKSREFVRFGIRKLSLDRLYCNKVSGEIAGIKYIKIDNFERPGDLYQIK